MTTHHGQRKQLAHRGQPAHKKGSKRFNADHLALPGDEIRRLVLLTTTRYKIEPFVRQLIRLMDELRAGQTSNIAKLTKPGRDKSRAILFAAIAKIVNEGRTMAAYHTAYQATLYAYENSLDHLLAFHEYLDRFKQPQPNTPPT
ncbi:MAG TPA: hypothetical protein VGO73_11435 [Pyrinomonadaceae bacterium]|jgi:hypothetical protein|nr:hypothetical protein [Pyrinomonadaceae bacterium]